MVGPPGANDARKATSSMASTTQTEHALMTLRQRVLSGRYAGGERLYEVALATDLDISRTPVRAALSKLAEEGLLDRAPGGGFSVRRFEIGDVLDAIELRGVLEGTAARLAAERGAGAAALSEMAGIVAALDRVVAAPRADLADYSELNRAFHDALARLSGSRVIERELARVTALPFASPSAFLDDDGRTPGIVLSLAVAQEQHRALLEAIRERQGARAEAIAREHARQAQRNVAFLTTDAAALREGAAPLALVSG